MREAVYILIGRLPFFAFTILVATLLVAATFGMVKHSNDPSVYGANSSISSDSLLEASGLAPALKSLSLGIHSVGTSIMHGVRATGMAIVDSTRFVGNVLHAITFGVLHGVASVYGAIFRFPGHVVSFTANALDLNHIIKPADTIHVPTFVAVAAAAPLPVTPAPIITPTPQQPAPTTYASGAITPTTIPAPQSANLYARGNCTWWVSYRRFQINDPIPQWWGNAATWASRAARDGYTVDHRPSPGAIMQTANSAGGLGHVALVESVDPDGTWHISEMNFYGYGVVDHRANPPSLASSYNFIHDN